LKPLQEVQKEAKNHSVRWSNA